MTGQDSGSRPTKGKMKVSVPITDEILEKKMREMNPAEILEMIQSLRSRLRAVAPMSRATATTVQYGVDVDGEFVPLVHFGVNISGSRYLCGRSALWAVTGL